MLGCYPLKSVKRELISKTRGLVLPGEEKKMKIDLERQERSPQLGLFNAHDY